MSRGVPGPLRRLLRQPLVTAGVATIALTALAAAGVGSFAAAVLRATVDDNWRGAYDILITPPDAQQPIDGMLAPNALASTAVGLTLDDLAAIRALDGVEVAAPIGDILVPGLKTTAITFVVPKGLPGASDAPQAFRVTATYSTDDGLGERIVWTSELPIIIDETGSRPANPQSAQCGSDPEQVSGYNDYDYRVGDYPRLTEWVCNGFGSAQSPNGVATIHGPDSWGFTNDQWGSETLDHYPVSLPANLLSTTRITLVDPVAERELLGAEGTFLDRLIEVAPTAETDMSSLSEWAATRPDDPLAERVIDRVQFALANSTGMPDDVVDEVRELYAANGADLDAHLKEISTGRRTAPLLVSRAATTDLTVKVDVEAFGSTVGVLDGAAGAFRYETPRPLLDGAAGDPVGSATADASVALNPFLEDGGSVTWPGARVEQGEDVAGMSWLQFMAVGRAAASHYTAGSTGVSLAADGYRAGIWPQNAMPDFFGVETAGEDVGLEAVYSQADALWAASDTAVLAVAVGAYEPPEIATDDDADYVPLGAYGDIASTVTGGPHAGAEILPSVSGLGLVSSRTAAIGSIESAALWQEDAPIDAVRVRVGGISGYTTDAQAKVVAVAAAAERLGFDASIVAGSSPADVSVHVDGYAFGTTDARGAQTVGALGTVTQRWSEVSAVARADLALSTSSTVVLAIALFASISLLGAAQIAGIPARRQQAVVMRALGFTRARIARWYAAEEAPALVLVTIAGLLAWWLAVDRALVGIAATVGAGAVIVAAAASVIAGAHARPLARRGSPRSRRLGARSPRGFGARQALIHAVPSVVHVLSLVLVGAAATATVFAILRGRDEAGQSSLALLVVAQTTLPHVTLGAVGLLGGILLAALTRRVSVSRRAEQWAALRATGWTSRDLARAERAEGVAIIAPAVVLGASLPAVGAQVLDIAEPVLPAVIAGAAACAVGLIVFIPRRRGVRR